MDDLRGMTAKELGGWLAQISGRTPDQEAVVQEAIRRLRDYEELGDVLVDLRNRISELEDRLNDHASPDQPSTESSQAKPPQRLATSQRAAGSTGLSQGPNDKGTPPDARHTG